MVGPEHITTDSLRRLGVFSGLPEQSLNWLLQAGSLSHLRARRALSSLDPSAVERYCFVIEGALAITQRGPGGWASFGPPSNRAWDADVEYVGCLDRGTCFSDGFLRVVDASSSSPIDCVATCSTTLLRIEAPELAALASLHADWRAALVQRMQAERDRFIAHRSPSRSIVQDFYLRRNYSASTVVRVTRRDQCIDCNKCFKACGERHGVARMVRLGVSLGRLTFPVVCRNCDEKLCLAACRTGALALDRTSGELRILEKCSGCGLCARACPNGAITVVERPTAPGGHTAASTSHACDSASTNEAGTTSIEATQPKRRRKTAIRCDNCADFPDHACLTACPTGALTELPLDRLFLEERLEPSIAPRRFSDTAFLSGAAPQESRAGSWHRLLTIALLLAVVGTGVEAFLRATQPEASLTARFVSLARLDWVVSYSSGRGFGHWLGYIGTSAMLLSVLYSVRTRVRRFRKLGAPSTWLSLHLWLGFVGGTLATYHSALKLDRWASIACILIWIVLLTGAVGRYLHGALHAGVGLAEFELATLRARLERWVPAQERSAALRKVLEEVPQPGQKPPPLPVILWQEVRDSVLILAIRLRGPRHLRPFEVAQFRECVAHWAANRRRAAYCHRAESMLRHWKVVHIVLAIVMFVLAGIHVVYGFVYKVV